MRARLLLPAIAIALLLPAAAHAAQPGVVQSANYPADEAQVTSGLGARWVRLFFRWDEAEPGQPRDASAARTSSRTSSGA